MASRASTKVATKPVRGAGVQTVYEQLRSAIVNLELPPGSPLDEVRLSQQFAMSRTPIREALVRLVGDGLVTTLPNRSTVVAPIDFEKLPTYSTRPELSSERSAGAGGSR